MEAVSELIATPIPESANENPVGTDSGEYPETET